MMRTLRVLLLGACLAGGALAAAPERWQDLTPQQRSALAPLKDRWSEMDDQARERWLGMAVRFPKLSEPERKRLQARMGEWARLSPRERGTARLQFQDSRRWSPQERQERWEAYQSLDPQARRVLAERWKLEEAEGRAKGADKRNLVEPSRLPPGPRQPANGTRVEARTGATTRPMSSDRAEPPHQQPGLPKVTATPGFVDPTTLLPQRGPQGAAVVKPVAPPKDR